MIVSYNYDRVENVLKYKFNDFRILDKAYTRCSYDKDNCNKELINVGKLILEKIFKSENKQIKDYEEYLHLPIVTFSLLDNLYCSKDEISSAFNDRNVMVEILYALLGAIYIDSNENYKKVYDSFNAIFTFNIDFLSEMMVKNYIAYIHYYSIESSDFEFQEEYNDCSKWSKVSLEFEGSAFSEGANTFEARYNACKIMFDELLLMGYISFKKESQSI